jgi:lipoprotein-releasing system permease protein
MPWPLYLALKQLFPSGRVVSFFSVISVFGVALGVALMLVATSVMGGFGYQIRQMIVDTQGEIQVRSRGIIRDIDGVAARIASVPEVEAASPFAEGFVMLEHRGKPAFPGIRSVDPKKLGVAIPLDRYLIAGSLADLDDDSLILSSQLALQIGARVGDTVSVYTPLMLERAKNDEVLLPREVRVVGVFEIGHQQLDSSLIIGTLRLMQDLYGLDQGIHGFNVRLRPGTDLFTAAEKLNAALPRDCYALTWFETNADFQSILSFERNMLFFLLTFIVIVAAFSITSSLLMTVVRKTREIGLLGAMGAGAGKVASCFCWQGIVIGVAGTVLGLAMGFALLHFRESIVRVIAGITVGRDVFLKYYQFSKLPAHTEVGTVVLIVVFTLVAATLAGLIPAWRAARLKPVEALRSE